MEKILLKRYLSTVKEPLCCYGTLLQIDDRQPRTPEEWETFFEENLGEKEYLRIFGN